MRSSILERAGIGSSVFALHGSASTGQQWTSLGRRLGENCELIAPDIPGYGRSAATDSRGLSGRAAPLLAMLELSPAPVHLVAHSFGAALALELLRARPGAIRSLWLYEPVVPGLLQLSGSESDQALRSDLACLADLLDRASAAVGMAAFVDFWHGGACWSRLPKSRQALLASQAGVVLRDFREAFAEPVPCDELMAYTGPVQIAVGERTRPHAGRMAVLLGGLFPYAQYHSFAEMGHLGPCTHPEPVNDVIVDWLGRVDERPMATALPIDSPALVGA